MNTIERVTEAIRLDLLGQVIGSGSGNMQRDLAKAALEALADGLKWQGNLLFYNGLGIGHVVASGVPPHSGWSTSLLGQVGAFTPYAAHEKPGDTESFDKARGELMQRARNWIMGQ